MTPEVKRWLPALLAILVVATGLRIFFAAGFSPLDDAEYGRVAYEISEGTFTIEGYPGPPVVPTRSGVTLPTAVMVGLFGPSQATMSVYPLLCSLLLLMVVFGLALRAFGPAAGLLAAGIWACVPIDVAMATWVRPDVPSTAWAFLGVFAVYLGREAKDGGSRPMFVRGVLAGLAFGVAWLCKESIAYFVPFCFILLAFDLVRDRKGYLPVWLGVTVGSVIVLGAEMAFYGVRVGDPLYRLTAMQLNYDMYSEYFFAEGSRFGFGPGESYWVAIVKRVALSGPAFIFLEPRFLYLPVFGSIALLYGLYWRDRRFYFPALLFLCLFGMFNFGSSSLASYQPLPLFTRYFYTLLPPAVVLLAGMLVTLLGPVISRAREGRSEAVFWGGLVAASLAGVIVYHGLFRPLRDRRPPWAGAEQVLATTLEPGDAIYTDPLSEVGLEHFWGYPETMNVTNVDGMEDDLVIPCGGYALVNPSYLDWLELNRGMWLTLGGFDTPAAFRTPPEGWTQIWADHNARLYQVNCAGTTG